MKNYQTPAFMPAKPIFDSKGEQLLDVIGLTKMEYAMVHAIGTPTTPAEFYMAALKNHPTWVEIAKNNPSVKSQGALVEIFKTKHEMDYLACSVMAEQYWKLYYYEKMFDNIEQWGKEEIPVLRDLFNKGFGKE